MYGVCEYKRFYILSKTDIYYDFHILLCYSGQFVLSIDLSSDALYSFMVSMDVLDARPSTLDRLTSILTSTLASALTKFSHMPIISHLSAMAMYLLSIAHCPLHRTFGIPTAQLVDESINESAGDG